MKRYTPEELTLVKEVFADDLGMLGEYEGSFKDCLEVLRMLNIVIANLDFITDHYVGPREAWARWYRIKSQIPRLNDIANYIDFAHTYFLEHCPNLTNDVFEMNRRMEESVKILRKLDSIDFSAMFGWAGLNEQVRYWLREDIFGNDKISCVIDNICALAYVSKSLRKLRELAFRDSINWDFVYEVGISIVETETE